MADSDDDVPILDVEDDETKDTTRGIPKERNTEIPNYKGRIIEADRDDDSKGNLQIDWDGDEVEDDDDEEEESGDEGVPENEIGEEFAKARREALREKREKRLAEEQDSDDEEVLEEEELWNFPPDKYNWQEEDVGEEWADAWGGDERTGWDPDLVEDWEEIAKLWQQGEGPPVRPYYVPYRKHYPLIPEDHQDIQTPQDVVEELDRYEEFLTWASFIFKDGSSYEGTVFDDLAHGKGVYTTALELCRYEGEWFQNAMEGHGVLEADIPEVEPPPDSEAATKWRAQGKILSTDYLDEEDREWIKMDAEDKMEMGDLTADPKPFEDDDAWLKYFGDKPEKGRYRYSGQWKHNRMHGCGLYEVNGEQLYGQFYFGELLPGIGECDEDQVAIHSGLAEIAAAKARMFILKPDGMVREAKGPYTDPQHPYMYEEEDMWMAPGFINAFYKVPEPWERYVEEVDEEREMWLNSFIKSPFRIPMPPELEYQWKQDDEFIVLSNRDSNPMYQYPENLNPEVAGDILLHTPTGNLINWAEDPDGNLRFFLQPHTENGEIKPEEAIPLPLGFDEFMGLVDEEGNPLDESRRGLSLEERKKLDDEDKKNEKKAKFQAKLEEMKHKANEKIKEKGTEMYIKELEGKVEDVLLEESFQAELDAVDEDAAETVEEEGKQAPRRTDLGKQGQADDQTLGSGAEPGQGLDKHEYKSDSGEDSGGEDGNDAEEDEGDEGSSSGGDDNDENNEKPRSFGKVAMAEPQERRDKGRSPGGASQPPFPTIFASLSLVPQMAAKQFVESSVGRAQRVWSSQIGTLLGRHSIVQQNRGCLVGGGDSTTAVHEPVGISMHAHSNFVKPERLSAPRKPCSASLRLHSSSGVNRGMSPPISRKAIKSLRPKKHTRSPAHQRLPKSSSAAWVLRDMEVLTMALPVQIL